MWLRSRDYGHYLGKYQIKYSVQILQKLNKTL